MEKKLLEVCCFDINACLIANNAGADRIELCANMPEGGVTPSIGLVSMVLEHVSIPVFAMIRPRGGNFVYNKIEIELMLKEISFLKNSKIDGFVIGALLNDGRVNTEAVHALIDAAEGKRITFHRAFDRCIDPYEAIDQLVEFKVDNILTSGQRPTVMEGLDNLQKYKQYSTNRINVMAGSGVNPSNVKILAEAGIRHFHFSSKVLCMGTDSYENPNLPSEGYFSASFEKIAEAKDIIEKL